MFSQYELEYLRDNVRSSEYIGRENHVYLHYTDWAVFCSYLQVLNLRPLVKEEKLVFLIEDEIGQYPIDFKARFGIDYSQYPVKPIGLREVNRLIWHTQLSTHNGGDFFNEVLDAHPNLLAFTSTMFDTAEKQIDDWRKALDQVKRSGEARRETFRRKNINSWVIRELCSLQKPTDKDIFVAIFLCDKKITKNLDPASRIAPVLLFQPHFPNIVYSLRADEKDRTVLSSEQYEKTIRSPIFRGFKYIKTFTPLRRFTTSHGATVKFMYKMALQGTEKRRAGKDEKILIVPDAVSQRVLNRSFMIDWQDRLYKDAVVVRFEDGKLNPKATFTALAAFLDIPYTESMTYCSLDGEVDPEEVEGNVRGFDTATVYRTYDDFVNDSERKYIEYFLRDAYEFYGYDFHYYDGQSMTLEQIKEWLDDFSTIDHYMRETWREIYEEAELRSDAPEELAAEVQSQARQQILEKRLQGCHANREKNSEILMRGLRFINRVGQPLHMTPKLELDPALLEQPLYH